MPFFLFLSLILNAQSLTQNIKGKIVDTSSQQPIPSVSIVLLNTDPAIGVVSDFDGAFTIKNVPIGRYDLEISHIGYEAIIKP